MGQTAKIYELAPNQSKEDLLVARRRQENFATVDAYLADGGSLTNAEYLSARLKAERSEYIAELFIRKAARKLERIFRNIQATMYEKLLGLVGDGMSLERFQTIVKEENTSFHAEIVAKILKDRDLDLKRDYVYVFRIVSDELDRC